VFSLRFDTIISSGVKQLSNKNVIDNLGLQCSYINGSPQNTNVPGVVELAKKHGTFIGGDDFKSGQTKIKSVLVDFLVSAGLKVCDLNYNKILLSFKPFCSMICVM